jgi:glycosyltransferase involved in cell wall biosynthesis
MMVSVDTTATEVMEAAAKDSRIRLVSFTRNFGKEAAILAGLTESKGAAVIVLDADLQHPPELIPQMLALWEKGIPVVEAVKENRGQETRLSGFFARAFYTFFRVLGNLDIENHSDFKLLDRSVVNTYLALPERLRFIS